MSQGQTVNDMTRTDAEQFLFHEAELIDHWQLDEWLELFTDDGIYWIPIDETTTPDENTSLVYDVALRRQERVFRLQETTVASQSPRSRTLHSITNVRVRPEPDGHVTVLSNQLIAELRSGDFRQTGLGEQRIFAGEVEHRLVVEDGRPRIAMKKIVLLNRDITIRNLTFIA